MLQRCKLPQVFIMSYRPDIISDYGIIKQKNVLLAVQRGLSLPCLNITASFLTKELVQSLGPSLYSRGLGCGSAARLRGRTHSAPVLRPRPAAPDPAAAGAAARTAGEKAPAPGPTGREVREMEQKMQEEQMKGEARQGGAIRARYAPNYFNCA